jgi:hypothetical protein
MKKALLLIVAVFAFTFANAQGFKFGVKAGWNYSSVSGGDKDSFGDPDYKNSYHFGIMPDFRFGGMFGLRPEILYSSKGYQLNTASSFTDASGTTDIDVEQKTNLNYLSVPILFEVNAGPVFFELGPEFAYMLAVTQETKTKTDRPGDNNDTSKDEKHTDKDALGLNGFDFGYVAGIGVNLPAGFGLGLRYNGGFISIFDKKDVNGDDINVKNSTFMLSLNYTFGGHYDDDGQ